MITLDVMIKFPFFSPLWGGELEDDIQIVKTCQLVGWVYQVQSGSTAFK
jgi:hypothetical protein